MEDNLARDLELEIDMEAEAVTYNQAVEPLDQSVEEDKVFVEPMPQAKPVAKGLTKLEVGLIAVISLAIFALFLFNVHSDLQMAHMSRQVQDVTTQIQQTEVEIENLKQHTQELSRYDRVNGIAEKYGLELHEKNIKNLVPVE